MAFGNGNKLTANSKTTKKKVRKNKAANSSPHSSGI